MDTTNPPILIAYDGSNGAQAAVDAAGRMFPGRRAVVLSVWRSAAATAHASVLAIPAGVAAQALVELDAEVERQAAKLAEEGARAAEAAGLDATSVVRRGDGQLWAAIVDAAEEEDAQAVVVGSRGLSAMKSALLGSVANSVVHHSTRPVLVVPA